MDQASINLKHFGFYMNLYVLIQHYCQFRCNMEFYSLLANNQAKASVFTHNDYPRLLQLMQLWRATSFFLCILKNWQELDSKTVKRY